MFYSFLKDTPVGRLLLVGDESALSEVRFLNGRAERADVPDDWEAADRPFREVGRQLAAYFSGRLTQFELPLAPQGTAFQQRVWRALRRVPFGKTASYGEIAKQIGKPTASRAVGAANGRNPLPIIVPCHRIIGANGSLVGFGGGLSIKRTLLRLEGISV